MNIQDIGIVFSICCTLVGGTAAGGKYYLDHEYVPVSSFVKKEIRDIKRMIRELEYDKKAKGLTEREEWELKQLQNDIEELREELD
jgi:hypothetical protein